MTPAAARVLAALPGTAEDVMMSTGLSSAATYRALKELREAGAARAASWHLVKGQGRHAAVYAAGGEPDAPPPSSGKVSKNKPAAERRKEARTWGADTSALQALLTGGYFPGPQP